MILDIKRIGSNRITGTSKKIHARMSGSVERIAAIAESIFIGELGESSPGVEVVEKVWGVAADHGSVSAQLV